MKSESVKCITFNKKAQDAIPDEIRKRMDEDRARAEKEQEAKRGHDTRTA